MSITSQNEQNTVNDVCIVQQFKKLDFFKNDDRFSVPLQWDKCQYDLGYDSGNVVVFRPATGSIISTNGR